MFVSVQNCFHVIHYIVHNERAQKTHRRNPSKHKLYTVYNWNQMGALCLLLFALKTAVLSREGFTVVPPLSHYSPVCHAAERRGDSSRRPNRRDETTPRNLFCRSHHHRHQRREQNNNHEEKRASQSNKEMNTKSTFKILFVITLTTAY